MPRTRPAVMEDRAAGAAVIGRRLAAAREQAGLSQAQVAAVLDVPQPLIAKLELGHRQLRFVEGLRLASLYGISPRDLDPEAASPLASTTHG